MVQLVAPKPASARQTRVRSVHAGQRAALECCACALPGRRALTLRSPCAGVHVSHALDAAARPCARGRLDL